MTQLPALTTEPEKPEEPESKQDKLLQYLFSEPTPMAAQVKAGYSPKSTMVYQLIRKPDFQQRMRDYATQNDLLSMPLIQSIEAKCLKEVERDPQNYRIYKDVFKQKKQIAGLLAQDTAPPPPPGVSIGTIERMQVIVQAALQPPVDAE